jgi:uncharacterized protein YggE
MNVFESRLLRLSLASVLCVVTVSSMPAQAQWQQSDILQYPAAVRFITISGVGTVTAVPDEVSINVTVKNWNKDLRAAYAENELLTKKVTAVGSKYNISNQDIQTGAISVSATYPDRDRNTYNAPASDATGYNVDRTVVFVLKNVSTLPSLLADAIDAGANSVHSIRFDTSKARKLRDEARSLAVRAAREKAEAVASELKAKVGKALIAKETASSLTRLGEPIASNSSYSQAVAESDIDQSDSAPGIAAGHLNVSSSVSITFELTD